MKFGGKDYLFGDKDGSISLEHIRQINELNYLIKFAKESNEIEGIYDQEQHVIHQHALKKFLDRKLTLRGLEKFVSDIQPNAYLRRNQFDRVWIGGQEAMKAPDSFKALKNLLKKIVNAQLQPWEAHNEYEMIHPFSDGNGRSGRALWLYLWRMLNDNAVPRIGFLHSYYYETLRRYKKIFC